MRAASPYLRSVMKRLHVLTAVSDSGAEYAARLTSKPIVIIPNGVDVRRYRARREPTSSPDQKTILYVGRLEGRKGVKYLLKAFALVAPSNPEVRLVIAGDGPERERLQALARELGLMGVTFLGHVSDEAKIDLMSRATIYCSPALFGESFGIVLLESMAAGVVSVVGNNCGYAEVMKGLGAMSIVDPRSVGAFAERLELMLYDTILRTRWKEWARRYIQPFDYANIVDRYEALYASALDQYG
jgi:phosphatidyl-myo-inositol alpha-mannosyltransferase